jgi:hypothetical protein
MVMTILLAFTPAAPRADKVYREHSIVTQNPANSYLCSEIYRQDRGMLKKIKELYKEFKPYVRVDLIMYGVLILLIILYFLISIAI